MLSNNIIRVNYQVAIWIHSDVTTPVMWIHVGNGWKLDGNDLQPVFNEKDPAPVEV